MRRLWQLTRSPFLCPGRGGCSDTSKEVPHAEPPRPDTRFPSLRRRPHPTFRSHSLGTNPGQREGSCHGQQHEGFHSSTAQCGNPGTFEEDSFLLSRAPGLEHALRSRRSLGEPPPTAQVHPPLEQSVSSNLESRRIGRTPTPRFMVCSVSESTLSLARGRFLLRNQKLAIPRPGFSRFGLTNPA